MIRPAYKPTLIDQKLGRLKIWEYPEPDRKYVIGIDVAEGKVRDAGSAAKREQILATRSDRPDYSCAIVLDMETARHCATWNGWESPGDFGHICVAIGWLYNRALLAPERNTYGLAVLDVMLKSPYLNIYRKHALAGTITDDQFMPEYGWTTSAVSRPLLIQRIHEMITEDPGFTQDLSLVNELRTMEMEPSRGVARARGRNKDDRVLALGIGLQARSEYLYLGDKPKDDPYAGLSAIERSIWRKVQERRAKPNVRSDTSRLRLGVGRRYRDLRNDPSESLRGGIQGGFSRDL